jgi:hypothetical protein
MNRQNNKKNKNNSQTSPWGVVRLGSFRAEFPQPRIPRLLGAAQNLSSRLSVYPQVRLDVPIIQLKASIVAGAVAAVFPLDISAVANFGTRFGALFREYAVVGAALELRMNNVVQGAGVTACYLDEEAGGAPVAIEALDRPRLDVLTSPQFQPGSYKLNWTPRDILDLDYVAVGTTFTPVYLKVITNVANFNSIAATTGDIIITGALAFDFRGYI